mmetsp:Transcript_9798/g.23528  ORF Transcript_9798/g.23528 Transcript_9798/m.23528 type:complete len:231 (+) Transcript_9798:1271-1963(+)
MTVLQCGVLVVVLDAICFEAIQHTLVQRLFDVALDSFAHLLPIVSDVNHTSIRLLPEPIAGQVMDILLLCGCDVHKFLGDASHVHACTTNSPCGSLRRWLYEVCHGDLLRLVPGCFQSSRAAATAAPQDEKVEVVSTRWGRSLRLRVDRVCLLQQGLELAFLSQVHDVVAATWDELATHENLRHGLLLCDLLDGLHEVEFIRAVIGLNDLQVTDAHGLEGNIHLGAEWTP